MFRAACEASFDEDVGDPPGDLLQPLADTTRRGCGAVTPNGWKKTQAAAVRALVEAHGEPIPPRRRSDLAAIARARVGVDASVYCWAPETWAPFIQHYAVLRGGEEVSLKGLVDTASGRIDLDPSVCGALDRYLRGVRPLKLSSQNLELAEALTVLSHQAEHLRRPSAPEATIECIAMQHVRPLVDETWDAELGQEIALHAWQIAYPRLPEHFRDPECRDGGSLDRAPGSDLWP